MRQYSSKNAWNWQKERRKYIFFCLLNQIDLHRHHHDGLEEPLGTSVEKQKKLGFQSQEMYMTSFFTHQTNKQKMVRYRKKETERKCSKFALSNYFSSR